MKRSWSIVSVLTLASACQCAMGYQRPSRRNIDAIGAPAMGVGTQGLKRQAAAQSNQPTSMNESIQKFTEIGRIASTDLSTITLQRPAGDQISLEVKPLSAILMDGKPASVEVLPEGADARASYLVKGDERIVERIDVRSKRSGKQQSKPGPGRTAPQM